ncbi:NlpC/P60 family protein [uncultured Proteiniphilum sp.]|uniref:C40 family peptidase n=1 Tax=uncultured Proteiniphilum sp. TaxID=497637 RepID=UPI002616038B|nr:NlpC/P60 family protein [uncultured Proteiniphilum sp.]
MLLYGVFTTAYKGNGWLKAVSLAIISLILASCGAGRTTVSGNKTSATLQDDIIQYGRQYLGKPYRYTGKGPNSFDCSGYTSFVFRKFGYRLDPSSAGQDRQIPTIARREELRRGDLVFFEGNRKNGRVGHVGIVTEAFSNGQFKFIHASTTSGVIISSSREPYYASRYLRGGRVLEENASYVTRRNPLPDKKQYAVSPATTNNKPLYQDIPEVAPPKKKETTGSAVAEGQTEDRPGDRDGIVVLVQTDPQKNPPLTDYRTGTNGKGQGKDTLRANRDMALRDESPAIPAPPKSHTVKSGETLYSISRQYGCSVEQLKEWNPQIGSLLKTGEKLHLFIRQ